MHAQYDEQGNYIYPEGFDPETGEWKPGYEDQQAEWERQYAEAQARWEAHQKQIVEAQAAEAEAADQTSYSSTPTGNEGAPAATAGTLASDEALAELRRKLTGGDEDSAPAAEPTTTDSAASSDASDAADTPDEG